MLPETVAVNLGRGRGARRPHAPLIVRRPPACVPRAAHSPTAPLSLTSRPSPARADLHKANLSSSGDDTLARVAAGELGPSRATPLEAILFYGRQDPHIPPEGRAAQKAAFEAGGLNMTWVEVNGAHAFLRDENSFGRYNPELAAMTYDWAVRMFNRVLKG